MTSNRPYFIRALNDWILDNGMTPHLLVDAEFPGAVVPRRFVQDGRIVLNISPAAVQGLVLGLEEIVFSARFSGKPEDIRVPVAGVLAIYARENGKGMIFPEEEKQEEQDQQAPGDHPRPGKPDLKVVK